MQALQGQIEALHEQAEAIAKHESKRRDADADGFLQHVSDEGGRHQYRNIVLDMQSVEKNLNRDSEVNLQNAAAGAERCRLRVTRSISCTNEWTSQCL